MNVVMRKMASWVWRGVWIVLSVLLFYRESVLAQQYNGKELVKASLVSDVKAIQPGQKLRVGILYKIEPERIRSWDNRKIRRPEAPATAAAS